MGCAIEFERINKNCLLSISYRLEERCSGGAVPSDAEGFEMSWDVAHTESREGFEIVLEFGPENTDPAEHFCSGNPEADQEIFNRIANGTLMWFTARVAAKKDGITLGEDYLGGCCYESAADFIRGDYYQDMVAIAIECAKNTQG
jgi:hypothetical protein